MKDTKIIKTVDIGLCPHCGKEIIISSKMTVPLIDWILKRDNIDKAKKEVEQKVKNSDIEDKAMVLDWLKKEDTILGPSDVPIILQQLFSNEKKSNS